MITPTITPEKLDRKFPVPPWANKVTGPYGESGGWVWDQDGYARNLYFDAGPCSVGIGEACDKDGNLVYLDPVCFDAGLSWTGIDDLDYRISDLLADLNAIQAIVPQVREYDARMRAALVRDDDHRTTPTMDSNQE